MKFYFLLFFIVSLQVLANAQDFYFGSDMSYVNEMEDCGVVYLENGQAEDPYAIFKKHGNNLVRLRLWHTPSWHDTLNQGKRYSDFDDIKKSIARAKKHQMEVLLDFHFSDSWADPSKQAVPKAWEDVVDNLPILADSLYYYLYGSLMNLHQSNLLPDIIQIGNETNKGILLSRKDNAKWTLDWNRNAILFNRALKAVRDFNQHSSSDVKTLIHLAGPENAEWLMDGFTRHGVVDFDMIGLSYYWAWHHPTSIEETGQVVRNLKQLYPQKDVMIVETGYIWTTEFNDSASNIISETHPDYHPASPTIQRDWLIDMTQEIIRSGGKGVIYWEPAWVSSPCYTRWGQGSHQEHATFFDFSNNLLIPGGIQWMEHAYDWDQSKSNEALQFQILTNSFSGDVIVYQKNKPTQELEVVVFDESQKPIKQISFQEYQIKFSMASYPKELYTIKIIADNHVLTSKQMNYGKG